MAEKSRKESAAEKGFRWYRNFNAIGAIACVGVGLVAPVVAPAMNVLAAINAAQAAGGEALRQHAQKKRARKG